jgi:hypothetical protein
VSDEVRVVPPGHRIEGVSRSIEPHMTRMRGGLLVASTGCGGDDQVAEVGAMLDRVVAALEPRAVVISLDATRIDELFAPAEPRTQTVASATLICFQKGSLVGWNDDGLKRLVSRLRELSRQTKLITCLDLANDVLRLKPLLEAAGIEPFTPLHDGTLVVEVHRPDGAIVTGLVASAIASRIHDVADETNELPLRAPRFNALALAVIRDDTAETRRAFDAYLKARPTPLALIAPRKPDGEFAIQRRNWPGKQAFVAYGDSRSLHRAASELGMPTGSYAVAAMPVAKMFAWAASLEVAVMLCTFDGERVWNVGFEVVDLRRLS